MARTHVIILVAMLATVTTWYLFSQDLGFSELQVDDITTSDFVPPSLLLLIRLLFAVVIFASLFYITSDKEGLEVTVSVSTGGLKSVRLTGLERLYTFTIWCWTLQGMYFALAAFCAIFSVAEKEHSAPVNMIAHITWVLFEISFALAYLVTFLVSFVLIPGAEANKIPHKFFTPIPVLCHNANAVFMGVELLLNRLSMPFPHIAFIQLFGLAYVIFAWRLHSKMGIFFYFFLDYDRPYAVVWYLGLFAAVSIETCLLY